jgi:hypothetical protein
MLMEMDTVDTTCFNCFWRKLEDKKSITLNEFRLGLVQFAIANVDQLMEQGRDFGQNLAYGYDVLQFQLDMIHSRGETVFDKPCNKRMFAQWKYKFNTVLFLDGHGLNGLMTYTFGWTGKCKDDS